MEYEDYEQACEEMRKKNAEYLDLFEKCLREDGLKDKTIDHHFSNVDFYLNVFLLSYDVVPMERGADEIGSYLGEYFIRKCSWSTPNSIKSTAASLKKFYKCMMEHGFVKSEDYEYLCLRIKEEMSDWQDTCAQFNDPEQDNPFAFPF